MNITRKEILAIIGIILAAFGGGYALNKKAAPEPAAIILAPSPAADGSVLVSKVVDGDTIELEGGSRVRMIGVNTPETVDPRRAVQCFGHEASDYTRTLLEGKRVILQKDVSETDKYGRLLRYVYLPDGTFVNLLLVQQGYAQASSYPPDVAHQKEFTDAQRVSKAADKGLWGECGGIKSSQSTAPVVASALPADGQCVIKGNISSGGKIYHVPGCSYYEKTQISEPAGERWFCTEQAAQEAGWRRAANCP